MNNTPLVAVSYPAMVGAILLAKRKELRISQADLAETVGLNASTWSRVENGDSALTIEQLIAAASALNVSASSILAAAEEKLAELTEKGFFTSASRAQLAGAISLGAIPVVGGALLAAIGTSTVISALGAGITNGFLHFKSQKIKK